LVNLGLGKVRTRVIKKVAKELLSKYPSEFTSNFEENKKALLKLLEVEGKRVRNRIAGYVTSLKKMEERKKAVSTIPASA